MSSYRYVIQEWATDLSTDIGWPVQPNGGTSGTDFRASYADACNRAEHLAKCFPGRHWVVMKIYGIATVPKVNPAYKELD
jgi:hypothetical protein